MRTLLLLTWAKYGTLAQKKLYKINNISQYVSVHIILGSRVDFFFKSNKIHISILYAWVFCILLSLDWEVNGMWKQD